MKKIFFDCGTHLFQGFGQFAEKYSIDQDWECYCFEANPITYKMSKPKYLELLNQGFDIKHFNAAVSDSRGTVDVNCAMAYYYDESEEGSFTSQGSNILNDRPTPSPMTQYATHTYKVKSIDFSRFIREIVSPDDFVLIKMDIEGSEFGVLDKLICDNNIHYISDIFVEFHEHFFDDKEFYVRKKESYINLFKYKGVNFSQWF